MILVTQLIQAAMLGDSFGVKSMLDAGLLVDSCDDRGRTPLMVACWASRAEVVALLLSRGASANATNTNGTTAFMYAKSAAMGSGSVAIMDMLIKAGADPNIRDAAGLTALTYAIRNSEKVINHIKQKGGTE